MRFSTKAMASCVALGVVMAGAAFVPKPAQSAEASYEGETLTVIIRSSPGGGYDFYGRLLARHIGKYLPGKPDVIANNMPGAGGIVAANYMANRAANDGTEIAILARGLAITQKVGKAGVKYDVNDLIPIGSAASATWTWVVAKDHPVDTLRDLRTYDKKLRFAATGPSAGSYQRVKLLEYDGFPIELITGYDGTDEKVLAIVRGDVDATSGSYESMLQGIKDEGLKIIGRIGSHPEIPDSVPEASDVMTENGKALAAFMKAPMVAGRPFFAPPGTPEARIKALQGAFKKALEDEKLRDEADRAERNIGYTPPGELEEIYAEILNASADVVAGFKGLMAMPTRSVEGRVSKVEREGRVVHLGGEKVRISKSRTNIVIDGEQGKRGAIKAGMECEGQASMRKGRFEAKVLECES